MSNPVLTKHIWRKFVENPFIIVKNSNCMNTDALGTVLYKNVDLAIEEGIIGEFNTSMAEETSPEISFDKELYAESIRRCRSTSDISYVEGKASEAGLLVRAANFRRVMLLKIVNEIAYRQRDFLSGKNRYLTPISIQCIANTLLMKTRTISKAISNKLVSTPRGIFELKSLLSKKTGLREISRSKLRNIMGSISLRNALYIDTVFCSNSA
ncbi:MAG: hypothetical protein LBS14_03575 [Holosporaceae bacterium]|jgi:DNA-directed RNA polymerase specialized sigma54-like protein|nr:hypothetical protein [Holosporaceae bacterium]